MTAAELAELAGKYETLGDLRRARDRGEPIPPRDVFRALAKRFPGCLNELDTLPLDVIDARAEALRRAAAGGPEEPWMAWLAGYHALLRAAMWIKPRVEREREREERLAVDASAVAGVPIDAAFVRAVADPPEGRLVSLVFARLAEQHRCPEAVIRKALFPRSRR